MSEGLVLDPATLEKCEALDKQIKAIPLKVSPEDVEDVRDKFASCVIERAESKGYSSG